MRAELRTRQHISHRLTSKKLNTLHTKQPCLAHTSTFQSFPLILKPMDSTSNPLASLPPQLQDIIQLALSAFIKESLNPIYIMILSSLWLGVSFSLFVALLYSSNPRSRRTPLFWISLIAIGFGTVPSILFIKLLVSVLEGKSVTRRPIDLMIPS